ncbi:hypothetical protein BD626DRAFT_280498 [Schizophyllum amplum]|uniref:Uncharacterized protein n=1 Tax=Schizophyllum amplum TaxID=97359 RepID=A0A550BT52_9AGAR|nr:hypothetical protein BD626DRAFT_280498 [Auriculariopsis ampla]
MEAFMHRDLSVVLPDSVQLAVGPIVRRVGQTLPSGAPSNPPARHASSDPARRANSRRRTHRASPCRARESPRRARASPVELGQALVEFVLVLVEFVLEYATGLLDHAADSSSNTPLNSSNTLLDSSNTLLDSSNTPLNSSNTPPDSLNPPPDSSSRSALRSWSTLGRRRRGRLWTDGVVVDFPKVYRSASERRGRPALGAWLRLCQVSSAFSA